ncbi:class I SAM-dependent methyltransferase [Methylacidiphilum caldifontis]|uniref:SAM-dependent methyltransferase n=1 Tax=Methylacidiphilum caldifontis TaxID=2795386 RepID=A0A4Y8P7X5_9BACT|nr:class I SAM-dependent methyltransferase [Methylacidiphilum caldifontis]TFE66583.1 hypothetical protein A7Q10_02070 [Methylacidiphilum caldifontis]
MNKQPVVSLSNKLSYDKTTRNHYLSGASHIKCPFIRKLFYETALSIFEDIKVSCPKPRVLDLGAGEGTITKVWLEMGAKVTAVDISENRLKQLEEACKDYENNLEIICMDVFKYLEDNRQKRYELVSAVGFLHHVQDYLSLIQKAIFMIESNGYFFSFEDPLFVKTLGFYSFFLSKLLYYCWRITRGDIIGGLYRKWRRMFFGYKDDLYDNTEYHAIRLGVNQGSIINLLTEEGFSCILNSYFSNQSPFLQLLGTNLNIKNYFYIIAKRRQRL